MDLLLAEIHMQTTNSVRHLSNHINDHTLLIALRVHNNHAVCGCNFAASNPHVVVAED